MRMLCIFELISMGFKVDRQKRILVYYFGNVVGDFCSDLTVDDAVICELKQVKACQKKMEINLSII